KKKYEIEGKFGHPLSWLRLDNKKSSRIEFCIEVDGYNQDEWDKYSEWHLDNIQKLETVFKTYIPNISTLVK
ncbi:TPA: DUF4268 domain-containing protein, partial [Providencia rettgeri]